MVDENLSTFRQTTEHGFYDLEVQNDVIERRKNPEKRKRKGKKKDNATFCSYIDTLTEACLERAHFPKTR